MDLSLFTKSCDINENTTLLEFADSLRKRYFKNSLKQNIRSSRGLRSRKHFNDETKILGDFRSTFLTNSVNNDDLQVYLAEKFLETPIFQKHLVIKYNDSILANIENIIA